MRRLAAGLALTCLAMAGCGGEDASSSLDEALGYLPADAPLAVIVSTDLDGDQADALGEAVGEVPFGPLLLEQLESELEDGDVDFDRDVRPLLGNELVVGVTAARDLLADEVRGFVAALQTEDGSALEQLLTSDDAEEVGEAGGARLYRAGDTWIAVEGDVLVVSDGERALRDALERRDGDDRLREDDIEEAFDDLPDGAAARLYVNVAALLDADPSTEVARRIPFVDALETLAVTASVDDGHSVAIDFALVTGEELDEDELPLAAGDDAPPVIGRDGEIGAGIRDPARIVAFSQRVAQAVSPRGFADFQTAKRQIDQGLGVDLDRDLVAQFSGDASVAVDLQGNVAIRSELADPEAFERTLDRLVRVIPSFARGAGLGDVGVSRPRGGEDFYAVAGEDGKRVVYGVVDDVFVLANDARRAADLASEDPREVDGAQGALVARVDAAQLAQSLLAQFGELAGGLAIELPFGPLTGTLGADDDGLRGRLSLDLER